MYSIRIKTQHIPLIAFLFLGVFSVKAQTDSTKTKPDTLNTIQTINEELLKNLSVKSPTAAALSKYADIPVNYNTGVPNIEIPIAVVKGTQLEMPISLSYHGSGIKVSELASWVGLNWSLNAGGVITRQIMGGPDESYAGNKDANIDFSSMLIAPTRGGFYSDYGFSLPKYGSSDNALSTSSFEKHDKFMSAAIGYYDTAPDVFSFNVGGYAGKFYFDNQRQPHFVPEMDFKVEVNFSGSPIYEFNEFVLISPDGTRYYFGGNNAYEKTGTINGFAFGGTYLKTAWYLTKVESADLTDQILLFYVDEGHSFYNLKQERYESRDPIEQQYADPNFPYLADNTQVETKRLVHILSAQTRVDFVANNTRQDISSQFTKRGYQVGSFSAPKMLDEIRVSSRYNATEGIKFILTHDYYQAVQPTNTGSFEYQMWFYTGPGNEDKKRLRLLSVQEKSVDESLTKPPYTFTYEPTVLPRRLSLQRDHWGYYNGQINNKSLIDDAYMNPKPNRSVNWTYMKAGHLQKITYPTGGSVEFIFEPHYDTPAKTTYKGGLRIFKKIENFATAPAVETVFTYGTNIQPLDLSNYKQTLPFPSFSGSWTNYFAEPGYAYGDHGSSPAPFIAKCDEAAITGPWYLFVYSSSLYNAVGSFIGMSPHYVLVSVSKTGAGKSTFEYGAFSAKYFTNTYPYSSGDLVNFVNSRKLIAERQYNEAGQIQQKTEYIFNPLPGNNAPIIVDAYLWEAAQKCGTGSTLSSDNRYMVSKFSYPLTRSLLLEKIETTYNPDGSNPNVKSVKYRYGDRHENPIREAMARSKGDSLITETKYAFDYTIPSSTVGMAGTLKRMQQRNMNMPIETIKFIKKSGDSDAGMKAVWAKLERYNEFLPNDDILKPTDIHLLKTAENPISFTRSSIIGGSFIFDTANYEKRADFSFNSAGLLYSEKLEKLPATGYIYFSDGLLQQKKEALGLASERVSVFTHSQLFGPTLIRMPNGIQSQFLYDKLGRLDLVKDNLANITDRWKYLYADGSVIPGPPAAPAISQTAASLCSVTLSASGCSGTINWSNGASGASISVSTANSNTYTATCSNAAGTSGNSNALNIPLLPNGWTATDVGSPPQSGCSAWLKNTSGLNIAGSGSIAGNNDSYHWVYKSQTGDITVVAKLESSHLQTSQDFGQRSGIMIRASNAANAPYFMLIYDVDGKAIGKLVRNNSTDTDHFLGFAAVYPSSSAPLWIRLKKSGNTYTAWYAKQSGSPAWNLDSAWIEIPSNSGDSTIPNPILGGSYLIGFGVYNGSATTGSVNSIFHDISTNGNDIRN